ncbi:TolB-like translocation protein [Sediminitomix flava]|uniref:WD40 repeat protein n=1 Tax=Sediminitomix flava TaxID=379075 RepID=A0A315ZEU5_SEDFL|nr:hypothetical protein [Sediminitomix flava]PWJ43852.1 hypothetical protein BC781_101198 [Sediminitomix flava]
MKHTFIILLCLLTTSVFAQSSKLIKLDVKGYRAKLSANGNELIYTSTGLKGLKYYNLKERKEKILSEEIGAGYQPFFNNGKIVFQEKVGGVERLKEYNLLSKNSVLIKSDKSPREWLTQKVSTSSRVSKVEAMVASTSERLNKYELTYSDGSRQSMSPMGTNEKYIWVNLSPDKTKVLFKVVGLSAFVADLKGNILHDLGDLDSPKWVDDSKIVYMKTEEDHDSFIKADIYTVDLSNLEHQKLTEGIDQIALYPDMVSNKLVFNTPTGDIYLLEIAQ